MRPPYFLVTISRNELDYGGNTFKAKNIRLETQGPQSSLIHYTDEQGEVTAVHTGRVKSLRLVTNEAWKDMLQLDGVTHHSDDVKERHQEMLDKAKEEKHENS